MDYNKLISNLGDMTEDELISLYEASLGRENYDFVTAGITAGELHERGYEEVEKGKGAYKFEKLLVVSKPKKTKKVA